MAKILCGCFSPVYCCTCTGATVAPATVVGVGSPTPTHVVLRIRNTLYIHVRSTRALGLIYRRSTKSSKFFWPAGAAPQGRRGQGASRPARPSFAPDPPKSIINIHWMATTVAGAPNSCDTSRTSMCKLLEVMTSCLLCAATISCATYTMCRAVASIGKAPTSKEPRGISMQWWATKAITGRMMQVSNCDRKGRTSQNKEEPPVIESATTAACVCHI